MHSFLSSFVSNFVFANSFSENFNIDEKWNFRLNSHPLLYWLIQHFRMLNNSTLLSFFTLPFIIGNFHLLKIFFDIMSIISVFFSITRALIEMLFLKLSSSDEKYIDICNLGKPKSVNFPWELVKIEQQKHVKNGWGEEYGSALFHGPSYAEEWKEDHSRSQLPVWSERVSLTTFTQKVS